MAFVYISEFALPAIGANGHDVAAPYWPSLLAKQKIAIAAGSTPSAAFNSRTTFVQIHTDAICSIAYSNPPGSTPTATILDDRYAANETRFLGVRGGDLIANIANT